MGAPIAIAGVALLVLVGAAPRPRPARVERRRRRTARSPSRWWSRPAARWRGQTIAQAGLRNLDGVYLVELHDEARTVAPVAPDRVLRDGARLVFAGNVDRIVDLQRIPGLAPAAEPHFSVVEPRPGAPVLRGRRRAGIGTGGQRRSRRSASGPATKPRSWRSIAPAARVGAKLGDVVPAPG